MSQRVSSRSTSSSVTPIPQARAAAPLASREGPAEPNCHARARQHHGGVLTTLQMAVWIPGRRAAQQPETRNTGLRWSPWGMMGPVQ